MWADFLGRLKVGIESGILDVMLAVERRNLPSIDTRRLRSG